MSNSIQYPPYAPTALRIRQSGVWHYFEGLSGQARPIFWPRRA